MGTPEGNVEGVDEVMEEAMEIVVEEVADVVEVVGELAVWEPVNGYDSDDDVSLGDDADVELFDVDPLEPTHPVATTLRTSTVTTMKTTNLGNCIPPLVSISPSCIGFLNLSPHLHVLRRRAVTFYLDILTSFGGCDELEEGGIP